MVDAPRRELPIELLGAQGLEVIEQELPQLEDVVPRELRPPLHDHRPRAQQLRLYGGAER